ncbi:MAG TPA: hypothetical protein VH481_05495 [Nitrososphaeraceae archaeon]
MKSPFLFIISFFVVLLIVLICPSYQQASSQIPGGVPPSQTQLESIKIINLTPFQKVDLNKELAISGESSDSIAKDCSVYIIVNGVLPYQNAVASGTGGAKDYSQWKFVLHEQYTHLKEGNNKITAKLLCASAPTRWYSVVVNGVPNSNVSEAVSPVQSNQQQSNVSEANNTSNRLIVTITSQKDPVARGDTQNSTITVTDSSHRAISNAQINGKLIYPGNNFEKDFKGITDFEGKFVYSWIVGKKGDVGPLVMRVEASSEGYPPASAENSFEIVKSSESSIVKNPFQSHFQKP